MTNAKFDPDGKLYLRRGKEWVRVQCPIVSRFDAASDFYPSDCKDTCALMQVADASDDNWTVTLCNGSKYYLSSWNDGLITFRKE